MRVDDVSVDPAAWTIWSCQGPAVSHISWCAHFLACNERSSHGITSSDARAEHFPPALLLCSIAEYSRHHALQLNNQGSSVSW